MITETIISLFTFIPLQLLKALPDFSIEFPDSVFDGFVNILSGLAYILPIAGLLPIFAISIGMSVFKVAWALVIRTKSFIPTMGD